MSSKIKEARNSIGMSQRAFAAWLSIPRRTIENWESEVCSPPEWAEKLILEKVSYVPVKERSNNIHAEIYTHYGVEIVYEYLREASFEATLHASNIAFTLLPIHDRVVKYFHSGRDIYVYIVPTETGEHLFSTSKIPDDLDWVALGKDVLAQCDGAAPVRMQSRLAKYLSIAYEEAEDALHGKFFPSEDPVTRLLSHHEYPQDEMIRELSLQLARHGYGWYDFEQALSDPACDVPKETLVALLQL